MLNLRVPIHCSWQEECEGKELDAPEAHAFICLWLFFMTPAILLQGTQSQNGFKTTLSLNTFNTGDENWWMTSEKKKKNPTQPRFPTCGSYLAGQLRWPGTELWAVVLRSPRTPSTACRPTESRMKTDTVLVFSCSQILLWWLKQKFIKNRN